ncbi:MAG: MAPEG family protein [Pseudomonadota bacterium]
MTLQITALYAILLALLAMWLGARVSILRAKNGISILDGGDKQLAERMRQHGNFIENVPLALILMGLAEMNGAGSTLLHVIGVLLLASRVLHPFGINFDKPNEVLRGVGSTGTSLSMLIAMGYLGWSMFG